MQPGGPLSPDASALERLPHLARQICEWWGKEEFESRLSGVIMDSRDGRRQGLPQDAVDELLFLADLTIARRALYASETTGIPFRQAYRMHLEKSRTFGVPQTGGREDPWSNPHDGKEVGRMDRSAQSGRAAATRRAPRKKKSWWRRLIGA
jgi:hypothetical protein